MNRSSRLNVNDDVNIPPQVVQAFRNVTIFIRSAGLLLGGVFASLTDWLLGGITYSLAFSAFPGWEGTPTGIFAAGIISMGLWGVQIMLWQFLLNGGLTEKRKMSLPVVLGLIAVVVLKIGDDFTDVGGIIYVLQGNPLEINMAASIYKPLYNSLVGIIWIMTGFSEAFLSFAVYFLRGSEQTASKSTTYRPGNRPSRPAASRPDASYRPKATPSVPNRPLYNEPTYHPIGMNSENNKRNAR